MKTSVQTFKCEDAQTSEEEGGVVIPQPYTTSKGSLRLSGDLTQIIGPVFETLECFNVVSSERGNVTVTAGAVGSLEYIGAEPADAELHFGINASFAVNEELEIMMFVNGVAYSANSAHLRGLGANKPVTAFWVSHVVVQPGDIIELYAKNALPADMEILFHRTVMALKIDIVDVVIGS